jgi:hypothetical protein
MRFEIALLLITGLIIANIYTDGKFLKRLLSYKKYYQMGGVAFGALMIYWLLKKNPEKAKQMVMSSGEYIKYLPIDRNTKDFVSPILDFTTKTSFPSANFTGAYDNTELQEGGFSRANNIQNIQNGVGKQTTKRSVSETKKKYVASRQNWHCAKCKDQLNAYFEIDHKLCLKNGGTNHVDNLEALCPNCHREKTAMDNMSL